MSKNGKEIPAIEKKIRKTVDKRSKVDKLLGIDKPTTKHTGALSRNQIEASRTFQLIIKQNHSILEYFKKEQEIEELRQSSLYCFEDLENQDEWEEEDLTQTQIQPDEE